MYFKDLRPGRSRFKKKEPRLPMRPAYTRSSHEVAHKERKPEKQPAPLIRLADAWWNRLIAAVYSGSFSKESAQYSSHMQGRDYIWNSVGWAAWGAMFPLLTIVVTQLCGVNLAGRFSMAFVVANLLLFLGNYGVRTYQVSDLHEEHSFKDYQFQRILSCLLMLLAGWLWTKFRNYDETMAMICAGVFLFRTIDAFADVYEGRLQQCDKLYLAGISMSIRCALSTVVFSLVLLFTRNLVFAGFAMAISAAVSLILLTIPLTLFETPRSCGLRMHQVKNIFVSCFPLFIALFLYALIDSMPKFAMEGVLSYSNQLYFNAMYFPAHSIIMVAGILYKPQLVRLARIWEDPKGHKKFSLLVLAMLGVIVGISLVTGVFMAWIGIPIMSFMYGVDFNKFHSLALVMVAAGGVSAAIDFVYQIITVLRQQKQVTKLYLIAFAFSIPISYLLVAYAGLAGAVIDNLVIMALLFVLLISEFITIRKRLARTEECA